MTLFKISETPIYDRLLVEWKETHYGHAPGDVYVPQPQPKARRTLRRVK